MRSPRNGEQALVPGDRAQVETSGQTGAAAGAGAVRAEVPAIRGHLVPVLSMDHFLRLDRLCRVLGVRVRQLQSADAIREMANLSDQLGCGFGLRTGADWRYSRVEALAIAKDVRLRAVRSQIGVH